MRQQYVCKEYFSPESFLNLKKASLLLEKDTLPAGVDLVSVWSMFVVYVLQMAKLVSIVISTLSVIKDIPEGAFTPVDRLFCSETGIKIVTL